MSESKIEIGDVVQLISGGCSMTVQDLVDEDAIVRWFDAGNQLNEQRLPLAILRKVNQSHTAVQEAARQGFNS